MNKYKISGHDSFVCRYAWIPKAVEGILKNPYIFSDEDQAIIEFGIGKNMVKSLRFWVSAMGVATYSHSEGFILTPFGKKIFVGSESSPALDPFLEDIKTLWLLHWNLCSNYDSPLFAWDYMFNRWYEAKIDKDAVLKAFSHELHNSGHKTAEKTLKSHLAIFLNTYVPTRGKKGEIKEDNLDSPLTELSLIATADNDSYKFNRDEKSEITQELFIYSLLDYRKKKLASSDVLTFRQIALDYGSPGQLFKLPEVDVRRRLENIKTCSNDLLSYRESSNSSHVVLNSNIDPADYLCEVYNA